MTDLAIYPLTPDRWDDLVDLFETDSITRMCWCMVTRLTGAELREFKARTTGRRCCCLWSSREKPPGLLAYKGEEPVGWIAVAPRAMTPEWNSGRKSSAVETEADATDAGCWGASCFFVRSGHRKQGMTAELLDAGIACAKKGGAERLEACPMSHEDKRSNVGMCVGPQRVFERAGFEKVLERKPGRPLMRLELESRRRRRSRLPKKESARQGSQRRRRARDEIPRPVQGLREIRRRRRWLRLVPAREVHSLRRPGRRRRRARRRRHRRGGRRPQHADRLPLSCSTTRPSAACMAWARTAPAPDAPTLVLKVPVGTQVFEEDQETLIADLEQARRQGAARQGRLGRLGQHQVQVLHQPGAAPLQPRP